LSRSAQIQVVGIRHLVGTTPWAGKDSNQPIRFRHVQRADERIQQTEYRRVGANAECQRQNRNKGEAWVTQKGSQGITDFIQGGAHSFLRFGRDLRGPYRQSTLVRDTKRRSFKSPDPLPSESPLELGPLEISKDRINILTPEVTDKELTAVPTVAGEQPGMGKAMGAVVGGAMGMAGGVGLAPALASLLVPGVGPVLGIGILASTLLGAIGAVSGAAIGATLENEVFKGLPEDELFVYEDALRNGHTVVVVMADDAVRGALELAGAETIDRAREMWWLGLRDVEKENTQRMAVISSATSLIFAADSKLLCNYAIATDLGTSAIKN
jgi:hypothetical protein